MLQQQRGVIMLNYDAKLTTSSTRHIDPGSFLFPVEFFAIPLTSILSDGSEQKRGTEFKGSLDSFTQSFSATE